MATSTARRSSRKVKTTTKSAQFRALLDEGKSIAEIVKITGEGYAFVYGVAKRYGKAEEAANRRPTRKVTINPETHIVSIAVTNGFVHVSPDGKVTRSKNLK